MINLEKEIERAFSAMIKRHGGLCLKWVCPGWSGVPDRIVLLPGGRVLFAELKSPKGGRLSKLQRWWASKIRALGFFWFVVSDERSVASVELFIIEELEGGD